jgi:uncharacterized membrane protein YgdD (TMEM256/DUF423 family)
MNKTIFCTGVFFAVLAVILGAFGAHGLEKLVSASAQETFKTGVTYQMYHALLLLVVGSVKSIPAEQKKLVYYFIVAGIVFFSFSIYLLATNDLTGFDFNTIGIITPIGGLLLIIGWLLLGFQAYRKFK